MIHIILLCINQIKILTTALRDLLVSFLGQQFQALVQAKQCVEEHGSIVIVNH